MMNYRGVLVLLGSNVSLSPTFGVAADEVADSFSGTQFGTFLPFLVFMPIFS